MVLTGWGCHVLLVAHPVKHEHMAWPRSCLAHDPWPLHELPSHTTPSASFRTHARPASRYPASHLKQRAPVYGEGHSHLWKPSSRRHGASDSGLHAHDESGAATPVAAVPGASTTSRRPPAPTGKYSHTDSSR